MTKHYDFGIVKPQKSVGVISETQNSGDATS